MFRSGLSSCGCSAVGGPRLVISSASAPSQSVPSCLPQSWLHPYPVPTSFPARSRSRRSISFPSFSLRVDLFVSVSISSLLMNSTSVAGGQSQLCLQPASRPKRSRDLACLLTDTWGAWIPTSIDGRAGGGGGADGVDEGFMTGARASPADGSPLPRQMMGVGCDAVQQLLSAPCRSPGQWSGQPSGEDNLKTSCSP